MAPPTMRCPCGEPLAALWKPYWEMIRSGTSSKDAATALGIPAKQYCCRSKLLATVPDNRLGAPRKPPPGSRFEFRTITMDPEAMPVRVFHCR